MSRYLRVVAIPLAAAFLALPALGQTKAPDAKEIQPLVDQAASFLKKSQAADGSFSPKLGGPGITALVVAGLLRNGYSPDHPVVAKGLAYLEKSIQKDGGVYDKALANYSTCVGLMAFKEANSKGRYDKVIANATKFLKTLQIDESVIEDKDVKFGGVGYDGKQRPDLSNTQYFIDALIAAGVPPTDPAIQKALRFIRRCQNVPGPEFNDQPFAQLTTDDDKGGFVYNPTAGEKDKNRTPAGGLRSSGVMTYAGLKSFLHAGVNRDDKRVMAAIDWIRRHYSLDTNPGQGKAGLFYYYHTFGKSMDVWGIEEFEDAAGKKHAWRRELFETLKKQQKPDGNWSNEDNAFFESNPDLATAYALLALSYCKGK